MSTLVLMQVLLLALALVMVGLGLSLTPADFRRLGEQKRAVAIAIGVQMVALPLAALVIAHLLRLSPPFAIGLMLLAATPGSISTNLFSHVFRGNVALNISLTGLNTVLCAFTLPLVCGWAVAHFAAVDAGVLALFGKVAEIAALIVVPVAVGMGVRSVAPGFARRAERPMRIVSAAVLVVLVVAAIVKEWAALVLGFAQVGGAVIGFNLLSVAAGYAVSRAAGLDLPSSITIAFQVSVHNAVLALYIAMTVLADPLIALPAAVYSVTMNLFALGFGLWAGRRRSGRAVPAL